MISSRLRRKWRGSPIGWFYFKYTYEIHLERENNELFSATTVTGAPCRTLRVERIILMWIAGVEYTRHVRYLVVLKESGLVRPNWTYHYLNLE